jgi:hypothetical protein
MQIVSSSSPGGFTTREEPGLWVSQTASYEPVAFTMTGVLTLRDLLGTMITLPLDSSGYARATAFSVYSPDGQLLHWEEFIGYQSTVTDPEPGTWMVGGGLLAMLIAGRAGCLRKTGRTQAGLCGVSGLKTPVEKPETRLHVVSMKDFESFFVQLKSLILRELAMKEARQSWQKRATCLRTPGSL